MRARLVLLLVVALVVGGAVWWWQGHKGTEFAAAVELAPAGTVRVGWTDWARVRAAVDVDGGPAATAEEVTTVLDRGYERDLTSASALGSSAVALHESVGVSPATLDWELFAQSPDGAALVLRLADAAPFDDVRARLTELGFAPPGDETGVWEGGTDVLARIGGDLTPQLQYWALLEGERLVVTSDTAEYAAVAAAAATGDDDRVDGLDDVVVPSGDPLSAVVYTGAYACENLAMAQADAREREEAAALVRAAGEVSPLTGFALAAQPGGGVRAVMSFETDDQARANADARAALATGPAPGQGGDFADRFAVERATAEGRTVVLELDPVEGEAVVSDLSAGPVLFATC